MILLYGIDPNIKNLFNYSVTVHSQYVITQGLFHAHRLLPAGIFNKCNSIVVFTPVAVMRPDTFTGTSTVFAETPVAGHRKRARTRTPENRESVS